MSGWSGLREPALSIASATIGHRTVTGKRV
jgi:hypothetical protein